MGQELTTWGSVEQSAQASLLACRVV